MEVMSPARFYTDLRRFMGSQFKREKKVQRKPQVPKYEDVVRYHCGAKTAKEADNAMERKIIRFLFVGNSL